MPKKKTRVLPADVDAYSERGARLLCIALKDFWSRLGHSIRAEPFKIHTGAWGVKSNLVNGLPR